MFYQTFSAWEGRILSGSKNPRIKLAQWLSEKCPVQFTLAPFLLLSRFRPLRSLDPTRLNFDGLSLRPGKADLADVFANYAEI